MKTLILDSSILVKWLNTTDEDHIEKADKILAEALKGDAHILAPELAKYEVGNVLLLKKKLPTKRIRQALDAFYAYPIRFVTESKGLAQETYELAAALGITYYDAAFLALAKQFEATLVTENIKHQGKTKDIRVLPLADY